MIEGRRVVDSPRGYRAHAHPTYSIGFVDSGRSRVRLGRKSLQVSAGDLVFIPEQRVHSCNPVPGRLWSYRMLYLDPLWLRTQGMRRTASQPLPEGTLSAPALGAVFDSIEGLLLRQAGSSGAEARLARLLARLLDKAPGPESLPAQESLSPQVERAKDYLQEHLFGVVSLDELAAVCALPKFRLLRCFKRQTGLTPHAYQLDLRITRARELLKEGRSPADTAYALGFADQSHFQRSFKPRVAATPGEFAAGAGRKKKHEP